MSNWQATCQYERRRELKEVGKDQLATYVLGLQIIARSVSKEEHLKANPLDEFGLSTGIDVAVQPDMTQPRKTNLETEGGLEWPNVPHLLHINSNLCWCDPIIQSKENGQLVMIHNEVTWN